MVTENVLVVTGASRGIGAAVARLAGQNGWNVCVNYHSSEKQAETVAEDIRRCGSKAIAVKADIGVEDDIIRLFETVDERLGRLTGLVNNAAVTGGATTVANVTSANLDPVFAVNALGSFYCAREAVRRMSTRQGGRGGSIVNIASIAARLGAAGLGIHYAASKAAVETLTLGLGIEVAGEGIRVNAVSPGVIDTEMHAAVGLPDRARDAATAIPVGRAGRPEEVAEAVLWLLSDKSSYVTGATLDVAGGR